MAAGEIALKIAVVLMARRRCVHVTVSALKDRFSKAPDRQIHRLYVPQKSLLVVVKNYQSEHQEETNSLVEALQRTVPSAGLLGFPQI